MKIILKISSILFVVFLITYSVHSYQLNTIAEEYERITRVIQMSSENKAAIEANKAGRSKESISLYSNLIDKYPNQIWLYSQRGDIYSFINEFQAALSDYYNVANSKVTNNNSNQIPLKIGLTYMKLENIRLCCCIF